MQQHFENLKKGMFVVITGFVKEPDDDQTQYPFFHPPRREVEFSGEPHEVKATAFPFIVVEDIYGRITTIDVRKYRIASVPKAYHDAFLEEDSVQPHHVHTTKAFSRKKRKGRRKKEKPDPKACPRCGCRMIETLKEGTTGWLHICPECGGAFDLSPK